MGYTKEQLLTRLKELEINFEQHEHPVVLTVEAALKYLANVDGTFCKNLFLKDKKHRFYIISALPETKVDMKVLSVRLGLGKGGLRMAPEEALGEILQVPLGCVTPFAVVNESARHVSLLLDQGLKSQRHILFHPLSNDMSIALSYVGLDKFLKSLGRDPAYVDLEANPPVGKDQPPDLVAFAPSNAIPVPESVAKAASIEVVLQNSHSVNSEPVKGKAIKQSVEKKNVNNKSDKGKAVNSVTSSTVFSNPQLFVDEILDKTSALILSEVKETMSKHGEQVADIASENIRKRLHSELSHLVVVFKNTAYTEGFNAGTSCHGPRL